MTAPDTLPAGTRVRTPRMGAGTVLDITGTDPAVYHRHWPVWVRLDVSYWPDGHPADEGYEARELVVLP